MKKITPLLLISLILLPRNLFAQSLLEIDYNRTQQAINKIQNRYDEMVKVFYTYVIILNMNNDLFQDEELGGEINGIIKKGEDYLNNNHTEYAINILRNKIDNINSNAHVYYYRRAVTYYNKAIEINLKLKQVESGNISLKKYYTDEKKISLEKCIEAAKKSINEKTNENSSTLIELAYKLMDN